MTDEAKIAGVQPIVARMFHDLPVEWVIKEDAPLIYTNNIGLNVGTFDVTLILGLTMSVGDDKITALEQGRVVMSPQHAKVLVAALANVLNEYERRVGVIPVQIAPPPDS